MGSRVGKNVLAIKNGQLIPTLTENDVLTSVKATLTYNGATRSKNYIVTVKAGKGSVEVKHRLSKDKDMC